MKSKFLLASAALIVFAGFAGSASAAPGYLASSVNLRAGPGPQYPIITRMPAGAALNINGCIAGWTWCDVNTNNLRGWISGRHLDADYNNRRADIIELGGNIGLPVVVFNQDDYWGHYYRNKPFYRNYHPHGGHAAPVRANASHPDHAVQTNYNAPDRRDSHTDGNFHDPDHPDQAPAPQDNGDHNNDHHDHQ